MVGSYGDVLVSQPPITSLCKCPCLLGLPPTNLEPSSFSLISPYPPCTRWRWGEVAISKPTPGYIGVNSYSVRNPWKAWPPPPQNILSLGVEAWSGSRCLECQLQGQGSGVRLPLRPSAEASRTKMRCNGGQVWLEHGVPHSDSEMLLPRTDTSNKVRTSKK